MSTPPARRHRLRLPLVLALSSPHTRMRAASTRAAPPAQGWKPGDPILFAEPAGTLQRSELPPIEGRGWREGDAIVFDGAVGDLAHGALEQARRDAARAGSATSLRQAATTSSASPPSRLAPAAAPLPSAVATRSPAQSPAPALESPRAQDDLAGAGAVQGRGQGAGQPAPSSGGVSVRMQPTLSQAEMDALVSGVDFDDAVLVEELGGENAAGNGSRLAPQELDDLVSGIDFSQDLDLSDLDDAPAPASPAPAGPAPSPPRPSPPPHRTPTPSPRLGFRTRAPLSPRSTPPPRPPPQTATDLFSPRSSAVAAGSPLRRATPLAPSPSAGAAPHLRAYGTVRSTPAPAPASVGTPRRTSPPASPTLTRIAPGKSSAGGAKPAPKVVIELSDDSPTSSPELVVVRRSEARPLGAAPTQGAAAKGGWFQRAGQAHTALPTKPTAPAPSASSSSSAFSTYQRAPLPRAVPSKPSTTTSSRPSSARPPSRGSKRFAEAQKQAELRAKWPRVFSYKTWVPGKVPRVVYSRDEREVERVLRTLEGPLGFDLEWDPYVPRLGGQGGPGKAALVQVCSDETILLVHVAKMSRFPPALKELVEDPERIKLGVQIAGDAAKLSRDFAHAARGTLELNAVVRAYDPERFVARVKPGLIGLQELTGIYLDAYLPKERDVRCARWSGTLSQEQLEYAANDVYASLLVLRAIQSRGGVSADDDTVALRSLSTTPYDPWSGFVPSRPAVTSSAGTTTRALPPLPVAAGEQTPQHVLTARKYEAFTLFHDERLPLSEITARMSIKPLSVVWNVLSAAAKLRERGVVVEWDVERLVGFVDEVSGEGRGVAMLREHGELLGELKRGTALAL